MICRKLKIIRSLIQMNYTFILKKYLDPIILHHHGANDYIAVRIFTKLDKACGYRKQNTL